MDSRPKKWTSVTIAVSRWWHRQGNPGKILRDSRKKVPFYTWACLIYQMVSMQEDCRTLKVVFIWSDLRQITRTLTK